MLNDLIFKVFKLRDESHINHWTTDSYADHQALGDFYDEVIDLLDKYVEAYIGTFGKKEMMTTQDDVTDAIRHQLSWINDNRSELSKSVPALENILDEIAGIYMKALFKLENLR